MFLFCSIDGSRLSTWAGNRKAIIDDDAIHVLMHTKKNEQGSQEKAKMANPFCRGAIGSQTFDRNLHGIMRLASASGVNEYDIAICGYRYLDSSSEYGLEAPPVILFARPLPCRPPAVAKQSLFICNKTILSLHLENVCYTACDVLCAKLWVYLVPCSPKTSSQDLPRLPKTSKPPKTRKIATTFNIRPSTWDGAPITESRTIVSPAVSVIGAVSFFPGSGQLPPPCLFSDRTRKSISLAPQPQFDNRRRAIPNIPQACHDVVALFRPLPIYSYFAFDRCHRVVCRGSLPECRARLLAGTVYILLRTPYIHCKEQPNMGMRKQAAPAECHSNEQRVIDRPAPDGFAPIDLIYPHSPICSVAFNLSFFLGTLQTWQQSSDFQSSASPSTSYTDTQRRFLIASFGNTTGSRYYAFVSYAIAGDGFMKPTRYLLNWIANILLHNLETQRLSPFNAPLDPLVDVQHVHSMVIDRTGPVTQTHMRKRIVASCNKVNEWLGDLNVYT
ncbi:hypothetical protein CCM_00969 [Cordyceps militaris CM01]|uniref:Uncharacterized protein n=1 Tax=Cordyceps militaris (strain CM01) TaxID=983644 RepID=G3J7E3_CORMM|nr:uncharacterized protein CCM_00969 [Cordyceps militaris CM01]EGX96313.1 hypothetical protein CCM_00969 [Cordyceps militaris CM01]